VKESFLIFIGVIPSPVGYLVHSSTTVAQVLILAIIVRALLSWFPGRCALTPITALLNEVTNPILPLLARHPRLAALLAKPMICVVMLSP
jgi:uncharacterized protein YggT (Ycf19 family)